MLLLCLTFNFMATLAFDAKVVGYYTSWAQFRRDSAKFVPEDVDGNLLTHVIYAFVKFDSLGNMVPVEHNDLSTSKKLGMYERFNSLKIIHPHLKTLLSVGGERLKGASFLAVLSHAKTRHNLASSLVRFAVKHGFDGVDIDWEYEKNSSKSRGSCHLLVEFLADIKTAAKNQKQKDFIVTVVVGLRSVAGASKCMKKISNSADWLNVIGYDFHGSWANYTDANAPLYRDNSDYSTYYVDHLIKKYLNLGVDSKKLVLGVPAYGRSYANVDLKKSVKPRNKSRGPGAAGKHTKQKGILSFYEISELLQAGALVKVWDKITSTPYAYNLVTNEWVSFDDEKSVSLKTTYAKRMGLGGVMLWALALDDFKKGYPLLSAINKELFK